MGESEARALNRDILNEQIRTSTAVYEYVERTPESMVAWFKAKEARNYPVIGVEDENGAPVTRRDSMLVVVVRFHVPFLARVESAHAGDVTTEPRPPQTPRAPRTTLSASARICAELSVP